MDNTTYGRIRNDKKKTEKKLKRIRDDVSYYSSFIEYDEDSLKKFLSDKNDLFGLLKNFASDVVESTELNNWLLQDELGKEISQCIKDDRIIFVTPETEIAGGITYVSHAELNIVAIVARCKSNHRRNVKIHIGISQPCCLCCKVVLCWFKDFKYSGTHGKLFRNWMYPSSFRNDAALLKFLKEVKKIEGNYARNAIKFIRRLESSE